jgi:probable HAF family extracellular repeat protein
MRTFWKTAAYIAVILVLPFALSTEARAAAYVAKELPQGTILLNNNGTLVRRVESGEVNSDERSTTVTVSNGDTVLGTYTSPVGAIDYPASINDADTVVGSREFGTKSRAISYANGVVTDLHTKIATAFGFNPDASTSSAKAINNAGEIVGWISVQDPSGAYAFLYKNGVVTNLSAVAGVRITHAEDINNRGQITGNMGPTETRQAYVYSQGVVQPITFADEGNPTLDGYEINDAGQVAGPLAYTVPSSYPKVHAFFYEGGVVRDITNDAAYVTVPRSMNNTGTVVGYANYDNFGFAAFIYKDGVKTTLTGITDSSGGVRRITGAISINDHGVILADSGGVPVLLTPANAAAIDPAVFNFESGAQGFASVGEPIVTVATSAAQKFAGEKSLALQFTDDGFAAIRVLNPTVRPGDTIAFRIYIPADSKVEWIQPYALGGAADSWAWHGAWTPVEALQLGAWNTITIAIPNDAHPLHAIGLEVFSSDSAPGAIYLDSIDYGVTPDTAQYHFETGTQGWLNDGDPIVNVTTSAAKVFAGRRSLGIDLTGTGLARVAVENPTVQAGDTITFRVFIPEGAGIDWIQSFAIEGAEGNWAWHGNWQPIGALQAGVWNTITVNVPAGAHAIAALGIELSISQASAGTVYMDSVDF